MKNNILIISYDYYPFVSANSFRWTIVAESLAKSGYSVFVITGWRPNMEREEYINGIHVYRVGGGLVEKMRAMLRGRINISTSKETQSDSQVSGKHVLADILKTLHDHTWKNIYWPDFACTWYFPALKMAKSLFIKHSFSHIITASIPFTSHMVGKKLKQIYPEARWIVDISDPFCFETSKSNNRLLYSKLNIATERNVFINAQKISILTNAQRDNYIKYFPESEFKMIINPNILPLDVDDKYEDCEPVFEVNTSKKMVFLGNLIPGIRTPERLLELFSFLVTTKSVRDIELHFFGNHDYCREYFSCYNHLMGKNIFLHGSVPRNIALRAMHEADYLVNIGNSNPYQEPSKVVEYASTGKPIINVMCIKDDSSAVLLAHYPAVFNCYYQSKEELHETGSQLGKFLATPPLLDRRTLGSWLKPYRIETIVENYKVMLFGQ